MGDHGTVVTPIGVINCGGSISDSDWMISKDCFRLTKKNTWVPFPSMNKERHGMKMVVAGDTLIAFSYYGLGDNFEKINWRNGDNWEWVNMDKALFNFCTTKWDDKNIIIIGGTKSTSRVSMANIMSYFLIQSN